MCRREIPSGYLENPSLLHPLIATPTPAAEANCKSSSSDFQPTEAGILEQSPSQSYQWFYEGRNGWWEYDERTTAELEEAYKTNEAKEEPEPGEESSIPGSDTTTTVNNAHCELLIAGFLYVIDFEHMIQYRRNEPQRRRKVKRDARDQIMNRKGVAGLRIKPSPGSATTAMINNNVQNTISRSTTQPNNVSTASQPSQGNSDEPSGEDEQEDTEVGDISSRVSSIRLQGDASSQPNNPLRQQQSHHQISFSARSLLPQQLSGLRHQDIQDRNLGNVRAVNQQPTLLPQPVSLEEREGQERSLGQRDDETQPHRLPLNPAFHVYRNEPEENN